MRVDQSGEGEGKERRFKWVMREVRRDTDRDRDRHVSRSRYRSLSPRRERQRETRPRYRSVDSVRQRDRQRGGPSYADTLDDLPERYEEQRGGWVDEEDWGHSGGYSRDRCRDRSASRASLRRRYQFSGRPRAVLRPNKNFFGQQQKGLGRKKKSKNKGKRRGRREARRVTKREGWVHEGKSPQGGASTSASTGASSGRAGDRKMNAFPCMRYR
uniref:Uncharacterized protein n=1 Tax=Chromera velia CCMP2878 TaxID=1169474 RepID=A0A0G4FTZ6_9ALVE|eukprot:Cvel_18794.t1-p1 / transcript=Cvel_18794.t1 / gene=Cvel_18794 / organism=Chromera_velia_CCMP2878 / gene_product=hypothetical protein / transcript_product=hypothetical protein / location=Cvel_scaffold1578:32988-33626(-) / protein_length=213 / sequence_SO=supercontig / SO=protein_coding / is_pseudo=false